MNEVGFHAKVPEPFQIHSGQTTRAWYYSPARNESLVNCLQASKDFLDYVLALPSSEFLDFTIPEFICLIYGILVLGRFSTGCDAPCIDAEHMRKSSNLFYYLDSFISKTKTLVTYIGGKMKPDFILHLLRLFMGSKIWYSRIISELEPAGCSDASVSNMSFMNILPAIMGSCAEVVEPKGSMEHLTSLACSSWLCMPQDVGQQDFNEAPFWLSSDGS
jgi:hypothetical protein